MKEPKDVFEKSWSDYIAIIAFLLIIGALVVTLIMSLIV